MNSYDQISGGMTASAAVDRFFRRVLADPSLAPQFDGAQLHLLAAQQRAFLTAALGSAYQHTHGLPPVTAGPGTAAALAAHLAAALNDVGVPTPTIEAIAAAAQQPTAPSAPVSYLAKPVQVPTLPAVPQLPTVPVASGVRSAA